MMSGGPGIRTGIGECRHSVLPFLFLRVFISPLGLTILAANQSAEKDAR